MSRKVEGLPIRVEPTGRAEVYAAVENWPEVDGVDLQEPRDLSLEVAGSLTVARTRIAGTLVPVVILADGNALQIQDYVPLKRENTFKGPSFSQNGAAKSRDVSFYLNAWAARKSAEVKAGY